MYDCAVVVVALQSAGPVDGTLWLTSRFGTVLLCNCVSGDDVFHLLTCDTYVHLSEG